MQMTSVHENDRAAAHAILNRQVAHLMRLADDLLDITGLWLAARVEAAGASSSTTTTVPTPTTLAMLTRTELHTS